MRTFANPSPFPTEPGWRRPNSGEIETSHRPRHANNAVLVSFLLGEYMDLSMIEEAQRALCKQFGAAFASTPPDDKIGVALSTAGLKPINGLRHPLTHGMSGWYIWCGEAFSESADFFAPQCARHFYENEPDTGRFRGLS